MDQMKSKGIYGDHVGRVSKINEYYKIYGGDQVWETVGGLDYKPTKKITNLIKKIIDKRARFLFKEKLFFDVMQLQADEGESRVNREAAQAKEDLLETILSDNKFHSKILKAKKDCSIGGNVAIKLWGSKDEGIKIIFTPAQEFIAEYNIDDVDILERITYIYFLNDEKNEKDQRVMRQVWEMDGGKCYLSEGIYNGKAEVIEIIENKKDTGLPFIPSEIIQNGGLTGETTGQSDVAQLWSNQDQYNKLTSDDIDALKFQMFGQDVITDASEATIKNIKIAPAALIDLQTDMSQGVAGRQAKMQRHESGFNYGDKFTDTINRIKNDMYDTLDVPNITLEQLKGIGQSGKSLRMLYTDLMAVADEEWIEWDAALKSMTDKIFHMIEIYNCYDAKNIVAVETGLEIIRPLAIMEDEDEQRAMDMEEVRLGLRSRRSYMDKWGNYENLDDQFNQIQNEQRQLEEGYNMDLFS